MPQRKGMACDMPLTLDKGLAQNLVFLYEAGQASDRWIGRSYRWLCPKQRLFVVASSSRRQEGLAGATGRGDKGSGKRRRRLEAALSTWVFARGFGQPMSGMSPGNERLRLPGFGVTCWIFGIAFMIFSYVASFGPAHSLAMRDYISPRLIHAVYYPLPRGIARWSLHWWRTHVDSYGAGIMF